VPFADAHGGIAALLHAFSNGEFRWIQPVLAAREIHPRYRNACAVTPGHDLCPRYRTHRSGIKTGEFHAFTRHAIKVRRALLGRAKRADVGIAHVVDEDDHHVGRRRISRTGGGCQSRGHQSKRQAHEFE